MRSRNIYRPHRTSGFTLIEMVVVMSILALISTVTAFVSIDSYRGYAFRNERDTLVASLERARSQSMNNMCLGDTSMCDDGRSHGVQISSSRYLIFQGTSSMSRHQAVDESFGGGYGGITIATSSLSEVVFTQLSGNATPTGSIMLSDQYGRTSVIEINNEGRISWTN